MASKAAVDEVRIWRAPRIEFRDVEADALGYIEGRAVPYEVWEFIGWFEEKMAAGVFDKSIKEAARSLPLMLWHDGRQWPIGKAEAWDSASDGLHGVWKLDDSAEAQRAARMARDGFLTGLSVGFQPLPGRSTWELADYDDPESVDRVVRHEARLLEVSLVPYPAYADAGVTVVRSAEGRRQRTAERRQLAAWQEWRSRLTA